jgi:hypothetical protein
MKELQQQLEAKAARLAAIQKGERALGCVFFLLSSSHPHFPRKKQQQKNLDRCSLARRLCGGFVFVARKFHSESAPILDGCRRKMDICCYILFAIFLRVG